jgi:transposase
VVKWSQRFRATGSVAPGKMGGHKPRILQGAHADWLRERIAHSAFTLRGLVAALAERGLKVDYRSVWTFVHDEKLSFKKTVLPSEQERAEIARKRALWKSYQGRIDPKRLVFIDETWAILRQAQDQYGPAARLLQTREAAQRQGALWPVAEPRHQLPSADPVEDLQQQGARQLPRRWPSLTRIKLSEAGAEFLPHRSNELSDLS